MQKPDSKSLTQQPNLTIKGEGKVDLMIKFNPSKIFEVCSSCHKNMELEYQRPLALFAPNGTDALCWGCGQKMAPEYITTLHFYYEPYDRYDLHGSPTRPLEELKSEEYKRIKDLRRAKRDSLVKELIGRGYAKEDLRLIIEESYPHEYDHVLDANNDSFF